MTSVGARLVLRTAKIQRCLNPGTMQWCGRARKRRSSTDIENEHEKPQFTALTLSLTPTELHIRGAGNPWTSTLLLTLLTFMQNNL